MTTPLKLLIIEDSPDDAELMILQLSREEYLPDWRRVEFEPDYIAALEPSPDLILADWSLPRFSGMRALQILRERNLDIPFIIVSGSIGEETAVEAVRSGAYDYILKDRLSRLGPAVKASLRNAEERRNRKRAQQALRESEKRYRLLAENIKDVIWLMDIKESRFLYVSPSVYELRGYTPQEVMEAPASEALTPESQKNVSKWLTSELQMVREGKGGERPKTYLAEQPCKDGSTVWTEVVTEYICDEKGTPVQLIGLSRDITERKRAEEERKRLQAQLIQSQKMESVGRLAGGVAHDFNNMLGVILGHAEMAMEKAGASDSIQADLEEIRKAAKRSADLTRHLLAFARKEIIRPQVLDLNDTVTGMLKMLRRLIGEDIHLAWMPGGSFGRSRLIRPRSTRFWSICA